jgi:glutaryl-CoA dehydrogenase
LTHVTGAWGAIAAMDCYDTALRYEKRIQFDKPIAGTQLQQKISRNDY